MGANGFRKELTTGRWTLPVAVLVCLLLWGSTLRQWDELGSWVVVTLTGYVMIEMNTAFTLIRTRTTLPVCLFWILMSSFTFLHPFEWTNLMPLLFAVSLYQLFASYESAAAAVHLFHCFLCLGLGSLLFPQWLFWIPVFLTGAICFRSLSVKSMLAGVLGLATPYWFLLGHAFWHGEMTIFYHPFQELVKFGPIGYSLQPVQAWVSWGIVTALTVGCCLHYLQVAYQDKTRTRMYLSLIVAVNVCTVLWIALQPQQLAVLLPIQLIGTSFLAAHSFILTQNRLSNFFFIVTLITLVLLTIYNLWMQFFNF